MFSLLMVVMMSDYEKNVQSVVEAERAFARMAVEKGVDEAFAAQYDDQSIHLQRGLEKAKKALASEPKSPSEIVLQWAPAWADVSAAGDLGYTTGPWSLKPSKDKPVSARGTYFTIWHREGNGRWYLSVDHGAGTPEMSYLPTSFKHPEPMSFEGAKASHTAMEDIDSAYSSGLTAKDPKQLAPYLNKYSRMHWNTIPPVVGQDAIFAAVAKVPNPVYKHMGGEMSKSKDMFWTYGSLNRDGNVVGHYVRVWRLFNPGDWKLAVNANVPMPPKQP